MDVMWFKKKQKEAGVTADDIAQKMGRSRTNVSHIYSGNQRMSLEWAQAFAETLDVPLDEVLKRAGALDEQPAQRLNPGFSDNDAVPFVGKGVEISKQEAVAAAFGGGKPGVDVWRVNTPALTLAGYLPGDFILVDTHQSELCKTGDIVIAQKYDWQSGTASTLLRRYEPPVLVAANTSPEDQRVLVVDGNNVSIKGKVTASWRN